MQRKNDFSSAQYIYCHEDLSLQAVSYSVGIRKSGLFNFFFSSRKVGVELIINNTALALSFREITHTKLGSSILPVREIATVIKLSPIMKEKKY